MPHLWIVPRATPVFFLPVIKEYNISPCVSQILTFFKAQTETFMDKLYDFFGVYRNVDHRIINLNGRQTSSRHVPNLVKNQKYNVLTIVPIVLYNQFKYFFNMFYLLIAVSQFVPALKVGRDSRFLNSSDLSILGYLFTYVGPLALVLILTLVKEGSDDYKRYKRDKEANSTKYQ